MPFSDEEYADLNFSIKYSKFSLLLGNFYSTLGTMYLTYDDIGAIYDFTSRCNATYLRETISEGKKILALKALPFQWASRKSGKCLNEKCTKSAIKSWRHWIKWLISSLEEELRIKTRRAKISGEERFRRKSMAQAHRDIEKIIQKYPHFRGLLKSFSTTRGDPPVEGKYADTMLDFIEFEGEYYALEAFQQGEKLLSLKRFPVAAISKILARYFETPELCKVWVENLLQLLRATAAS